jgi:hypothetical protein
MQILYVVLGLVAGIFGGLKGIHFIINYVNLERFPLMI